MHKLLRIFLIQWSTMLQYRANIVLWLISEIMPPLIAMAIWYKIAQSGTSETSPQEIRAYYIFVIFVSLVTQAWTGFFLAREILDGQIAQDLTRPLSVFWRHIANHVAEKIFKLIVPSLAIALLVFTMPNILFPTPPNLTQVILFFPSLILATILSFTLSAALGLLAFWLEDAYQILRFKDLLEELASGRLIPYALLPPFAYGILSALPFRHTISVPVEILLGQIQEHNIIRFLIYQTVWIVIFLVINRTLWKAGLKRYAVPAQ
jgi:ABC-2 type transport system permease protein